MIIKNINAFRPGLPPIANVILGDTTHSIIYMIASLQTIIMEYWVKDFPGVLEGNITHLAHFDTSDSNFLLKFGRFM